MRVVNYRLLWILMIGAVLASGAVYGVHRLQAENIRAALLWQADLAEQEGRHKQLVRHLRRYLEFAPGDRDVQARWAQALAHPRLAVTPGERERARFALEQVLARDPGRLDVRQRLVALALESQQPDRAREHLALLEPCADGASLALKARWLELKGQDREALHVYRLAAAADPGAIDTQVRLLRLLSRMGRGGKDAFAAEAESRLKTLLAETPSDKEVLLVAAELAQSRNDAEGAREYLERLRRVAAHDARVYQALAHLEVRARRPDEAVAHVQRGLHAVAKADRFPLLWTLANLSLDQGDLVSAESLIRRIDEERPPPGTGEYLRARVLIVQHRWFEAARLLERLRSRFAASPALVQYVDLYLGRCHEELGEPVRQKSAYGRVLDKDPTSMAAVHGYCAAVWALGDPDSAVDRFRELVERQRDPKWRSTLRTHLARMLLARGQNTALRWDEVLRELDTAGREDPGSIEVIIAQADVELARGRHAHAQVFLQRALGLDPKRVETWVALANLAAQQGDHSLAHRQLDSAVAFTGERIELRLARARLALGRAPAEAAPLVRTLAADWTRFSAGDRFRLLDGLASLCRDAGLRAESIRLWELLGGEALHHNDLRLRLALLDLGLQEEDDALLKRTLDEIKRIEGGESAWWLYGEAARRILRIRQGDRQHLGEVRTLLERAVQQRDAWPALLVARAELEDLEGHAELAVLHYRRAIEAGARHPRVIERLVQILRDQDRPAEAERELQRFQRLTPFPRKAGRDVPIGG